MGDINLGENTFTTYLVDHLHHPCDSPPDTDWYAEEGHGLVTCLNIMIKHMFAHIFSYFLVNS